MVVCVVWQYFQTFSFLWFTWSVFWIVFKVLYIMELHSFLFGSYFSIYLLLFLIGTSCWNSRQERYGSVAMGTWSCPRATSNQPLWAPCASSSAHSVPMVSCSSWVRARTITQSRWKMARWYQGTTWDLAQPYFPQHRPQHRTTTMANGTLCIWTGRRMMEYWKLMKSLVNFLLRFDCS